MIAKSVCPKKSAKLWKRLIGSWQLYVMLLPALAYITIFQYGPMYGVQIAFRDYAARKGIWGSNWVGLKHIITFLKSVQFPVLIRNTLMLSFETLILCFPIPIVLALLLNECSSKFLKKTVQNLTYLPHFISTVVMVGMINCFFAETTGIINQFAVRLGGTAQNYLGNAGLFRPLYVLTGVWQGTGWSSIIYLAALSGIDTQLHEAAQIDGASRIQRIWHIDLPGIRPTAVLLLILNFGSIMSLGFEKVYLMQNALNLSVSEIISTYVYKTGLLGAKFSYTSAIGLFNSLINFAMLILVNAIADKLSDTSLF